MSDISTGIQEVCRGAVVELHCRQPGEQHLVISDPVDLEQLCAWVQQQNEATRSYTGEPAPDPYRLITALINDERFLEDHVFKLYLVLASAGQLVTLEHPLRDLSRTPDLRESLPAVALLEREMLDLFGIRLGPREPELKLLPATFPPNLTPLRTSRHQEGLRAKVAQFQAASPESPSSPPEGLTALQVGPVHKDIIESGGFRFWVAGEQIERVELQIGLKHRGVEKLFETDQTLEDGYRLAERVSGDTCVAHGLAYCRAIEALADLKVPPAAQYWRMLLLELERVHGHLLAVELMLRDIAFDLLASEVAALREDLQQINRRLCGNRLLRGLICPGGMLPIQIGLLPNTTKQVCTLIERGLALCGLALQNQHCRDRLIGCGTLTLEQARKTGATGLVLRSAGVPTHDTRLLHSQGQAEEERRRTIEQCLEQLRTKQPAQPLDTLLRLSDLTGDCYARLLLRMLECATAAEIIKLSADRLTALGATAPLVVRLAPALRQTPNFEFGVGLAESHRGEVCYWVMKGTNNTIRRCKVRDPATYNWQGLAQSLTGSVLGDVPLINSSWGWSFAASAG